MSFHWNLSSSEDEFENDPSMQEQNEAGMNNTHEFPRGEAPPVSATSQEAVMRVSNVARLNPNYSDDSSFDEEEDSDQVEWEEGEEDAAVATSSKNGSRTPSKLALQPVTIDLNTKPSSIQKAQNPRKRKRRRVYPFKSLPRDLKTLLLNIHRTHMLTLTSRAMHLSRCCSDVELMHVAHSLIPQQWTTNLEVPSEEQVRSFCTWYFHFVNRVAQRRQRMEAINVRAGAPRQAARQANAQARRNKRQYGSKNNVSNTLVTQGEGVTTPEHLIRLCSYLSTTNDENPQLQNMGSTHMTQSDKTQLLVAMARSLGWRARFVTALEPIKCDLDVDHPVFMSGFKNVFQSLSSSSTNQRKSLKKRARESKETIQSNPLGAPLQVRNSSALPWVEILCCPVVAPSSVPKKSTLRWVHIDPGRELVNRPELVESLLNNSAGNHKNTRKNKNTPIAYALSVEHSVVDDWVVNNSSFRVRLMDVTPRYANAWSQTLKQRGAATNLGDDTWWTETIRQTNQASRKLQKQKIMQRSQASTPHINDRSTSLADLVPDKKTRVDTPEVITVIDSSDTADCEHDEAEHAEQAELLESASSEAIPTSKQAFKNHPVYAIASLLNSRQVLDPGSKSRVCGVFKGELVFRRRDVSTAFTAKKWLYKGRQVKSTEMDNPVKRVSSRRSAPKGFKALNSYGVGDANDGTEQARKRDMDAASIPLDEQNMDELYGVWQTKPWSPPRVGPDEAIPVNEYRNVEIALVNPGLIHLVEPKMSLVAKRLGIQYAPALLGFEGRGGNRTPTIRGIVVHEHNVELLREAHAEYQSEALESEIGRNQHQNDMKWKKLIVGMLTKDRLEREYGKERNV